jgi:hypothetical protein
MRWVYYNETAHILFSLRSLVVILCTNRSDIQKSIFCRPDSVITAFCMLLTTEGHLFPLCIYLTFIINETVGVFTVQCVLKLYIVFRLIFMCNGLILCVYDMMLYVSIGHTIFRYTSKVIAYSVTKRLMIQHKLKIKYTYVYVLKLYIKRNVICIYI